MADHLLRGIDVEQRTEALTARYRYRLRVTPGQAVQLQAVFDANRVVWNTALGRWSDLWRCEGLSYSYGDMAAELTDWRSRFDWLAVQPCTPQQQTLRDLGKAISAFFDKSNRAGRPRFKRKKAISSGRWMHDGFALRDDRLLVAVAGGRVPLRVVWSRPLPSVPRSVSVYRDPAGRWWASFVVKVEPEDVGATGEVTGLDVGLNTFATTEYSDADVANPRFARGAAKALARSQRNLCRKRKESNGRARAKVRVARVHARVGNQRRDFAHKQARTLARRFDRIGVEDLRIKNMVRRGKGRRKIGLNRAISDAAWGDFLAALDWQARKAGHEVVRLPARWTSCTCSACGVAKAKLPLAERVFRCVSCGLVLGRDLNAARNLNPGWAVPGIGDDGSKPVVPVGTAAA